MKRTISILLLFLIDVMKKVYLNINLIMQLSSNSIKPTYEVLHKVVSVLNDLLKNKKKQYVYPYNKTNLTFITVQCK